MFQLNMQTTKLFAFLRFHVDEEFLKLKRITKGIKNAKKSKFYY